MKKNQQGNFITILKNGKGAIVNSATGITIKKTEFGLKGSIMDLFISTGLIDFNQFLPQNKEKVSVKMNISAIENPDPRLHVKAKHINARLYFSKRKKRITGIIKDIRTGYIYKKCHGNTRKAVVQKFVKRHLINPIKDIPTTNKMKVAIKFVSGKIFTDIKNHVSTNVLGCTIHFEEKNGYCLGHLKNNTTGTTYAEYEGINQADIIEEMIKDGYLNQNQFYPSGANDFTVKINHDYQGKDVNISDRISKGQISELFHQVHYHKTAYWELVNIWESANNKQTRRSGYVQTPSKFLAVFKNGKKTAYLGLSFNGKKISAFANGKTIQF